MAAPHHEQASAPGGSKLMPILAVVVGVVVVLGAAGYFLLLKPAGARAKVIADRVVSAANMTGIYRSLYTYSINNGDRFPDHLAGLATIGHLSKEMLLNPARTDPSTVPAMPDLSNTDAVKAWIDAHCDYVYLWKEGLKSSVNADQIILYEKHNPTDEGVNILLGDGSTQWVPMADATRFIAAGKSLPKASP